MRGEKNLQETMEAEEEEEEKRYEHENETSVGEKRKFEECVKRKIIIFVNADEGDFSSGIFELDVKIFTTTSGGDEKKPTIEVQLTSNSNNIIQPTETFFFDITGPSVIPMTQVGACVVGDELFMIPDDRGYVQQIPPIIFNLVKKSFSNPSCYPLQRKINPLLTAVGDVVYALSILDDHVEEPFPEPSFESFNQSMSRWSELRCSPFHDTLYQQQGHAVLGESFILVCLERDEPRLMCSPYLFYSYNVATGLWKTVATPETEAVPVLTGKGAVLGNDIYTFQHYAPGSMDVFSYSIVSSSSKITGDDDSAGPDIMLSSVKKVHGLELDIEWLRGYFFHASRHRLLPNSCGLAIVKDQILCLLYSLFEDNCCVMEVCGLFFQLEGRESCTTLKSFRCRLKLGDQLCNAQIAFLAVLNPEETNDSPPVKRHAVQSDKPMDLAS